MGIIARQTIKGSAYSYLGALIGFVNVGLIMPQIFSTAEIGLTNLLISISAIFGQIGSLGFMNVTIKLFPFFKNKNKKHNGFLFLMLSVGTLGFLICAIAYYLNKAYLIEQNIDKSPLFAEYIYLLLPLIFISIFHVLMDTYNRVLFNASFGVFVKELLLRVLNLVGIGLFYIGILDFNGFILFYTMAYGVPLLLICLLLLYKNQISLKISFSFLNKKRVREILSVSFFGIISGFRTIAIFQIDRYLVNHYCDLSATGVYATSYFFGTVILLPVRALVKIASPVIAEAFKQEDYQKISVIYNRSTHNILLVGIFTFLLIYGNINGIMSFLPPEFETGRYVILFISIAFLIQAVSTVGGVIIQFSQYYRQYSLVIISLILSIIGFNIYLLPIYGIVGAALASLISFSVFAVIQILYVKVKFNMQPFNFKHIIILIYGAISYGISLLIPQLDNVFIDIIIRSIVISICFGLPIVLSGFSPETKEQIDKFRDKIQNK